MPRIYLDNAATSFPKPEPVYEAIDHFNRRLGAAAGRGTYSSAIAAADIVRQCRMNLAEIFQAEGPDRFAFTHNGTDALNTALHGLLRPGAHVVTTVLEHNSILRPLRTLTDRGVTVSCVDCDDAGRVAVDAVREAMRPGTKLVALTHASNVTGTIQPIAEIASIAKKAGALVLIDAAQTAGHVPISLKSIPVDLLATSGHKGLLGPLGTGVLYVRQGLDEQFDPVRQGGTGTMSEDDRQPSEMPERLEAGNLNVAGIAGLEAATRWILDRGVAEIHRLEQQRLDRLVVGLQELASVRIFGPTACEERAGIVSIAIHGWSAHELATVLDAEFGIEARAGLHCAPLIHRRLGTDHGDGLLRLSVGAMTTNAEIDAAVTALQTLADS